MAELNLKELRNRLLKETPEQWPVLLNIAAGQIRRGLHPKFKTLRAFVITRVGEGGLGMDLKRVRELLSYNPTYKHKAAALIEQIVSEEGTQEKAAEELGVSQGMVSKIITPGNNSNKHARDLWMPTAPEKAAAKIREKFGDEFAEELKELL